jgi:hypothetical protein
LVGVAFPGHADGEAVDIFSALPRADPGVPGSLGGEGEGGAFAVSGDYAVVGDFADGIAAPGDAARVGSARVMHDDVGGLDDATR